MSIASPRLRRMAAIVRKPKVGQRRDVPGTALSRSSNLGARAYCCGRAVVARGSRFNPPTLSFRLQELLCRGLGDQLVVRPSELYACRYDLAGLRGHPGRDLQRLCFANPMEAD